MTKPNPFKYFKSTPEIIRLVVMMYVRYPLSLRNVEESLHKHGIDISHETVRFWWNRSGPIFAAGVRNRRVQKAALRFFRKATKRHGQPQAIETDKIRSYRAAIKVLAIAETQETGRWLNKRAENSHLPFRRREYAMLRFRMIRSLQTFSSIHASIYNYFNHQRHLTNRVTFKHTRYAALDERRKLYAV